MSHFLGVRKHEVIDQRYKPEVLDEDGEVLRPEQPQKSHTEVDRYHIEDSAAQVAANLAADAEGNGPGIEYYKIVTTGKALKVSVKPVSLKAGKRKKAPVQEVVEIEAGGESVGSCIREIPNE